MLENVTLETDELGIWLVESLDNGLVHQLGHVSWKEVTKGIQQCLLQEMFLIALTEIESKKENEA